MTKKKVAPVAKKRVVRPLPQVVLEVHPSGALRWGLTIAGEKVGSDFNKQFLVNMARVVKDAIAVSGGRAELYIKDRKGRIDKGGQGRDSAGVDPRKSRG